MWTAKEIASDALSFVMDKRTCDAGVPWPFSDPPNTTSYVSKTVFDGAESVVYVSHDADDGAWQFLGDSMAEGGGPVIVCLSFPLSRDATLADVANLPLGWCAEREIVGEPWVRYVHPQHGAQGD